MVIVLINVGVKGRIQVNIVAFSAALQTFEKDFIGQPLLQFGRRNDVVNDALQTNINTHTCRIIEQYKNIQILPLKLKTFKF